MRFGEVDIPDDLSYTPKHLWVKMVESLCTLGWTDYIQRNAGDVNHVQLSQKGTSLEVDQEFGTIETSKWVDRLYSPVKGRVVEINDEVIRNPELINKAPFREGWLIRVHLESGSGSYDTMSPSEYLEFVRACEEQ